MNCSISSVEQLLLFFFLFGKRGFLTSSCYFPEVALKPASSVTLFLLENCSLETQPEQFV